MPSEAEASSVVAPDFPLQRDTRGGPLPSRIARWHQDHLLQHSLLEYVVSAMHSFSGQDRRCGGEVHGRAVDSKLRFSHGKSSLTKER